MKLIALDLELNKPNWNIIQIGACIGDSETGEILDTLNIHVKSPSPIDPYITNLTKITQEDNDAGVSFQEAFTQLVVFAKSHDILTNVLTWGGDDIDCLKRQMVENSVDITKWPFRKRIIDCKTVHQTIRMANGVKIEGGLAKAMTRHGLAFKGTKHQAIDDSVNTFRLYHKILTELKNAN